MLDLKIGERWHEKRTKVNKMIKELSSMSVRKKLIFSSVGIIIGCTVWLCLTPFFFSWFLGVSIEDALSSSTSSLETIGTVSVAVWAVVKWQLEKNKEILIKRLDMVYIPMSILFNNINSAYNTHKELVKNDNSEDGFKTLVGIMNQGEEWKRIMDSYARLYSEIIKLPSHYMSSNLRDLTIKFCYVYDEYIAANNEYQNEVQNPIKAAIKQSTKLGEYSSYLIMQKAVEEMRRLFFEIEKRCMFDLHKYQSKLDVD